ncbi:MAG: restriction endonuclease subunit S, partial [Prevotella sp.]|nr:restriction endonuclease subunit S [Prevotella sp.]
MKEGWEYKKLGEVAQISSGKAIPSSLISDTISEGLYPCYGGNGLRGYVDRFSNEGLIPVIGRVGALCGNVHLPQGKFYATEHALVVNIKTNDKPQYLEYILKQLDLRAFAK